MNELEQLRAELERAERERADMIRQIYISNDEMQAIAAEFAVARKVADAAVAAEFAHEVGWGLDETESVLRDAVHEYRARAESKGKD